MIRSSLPLRPAPWLLLALATLPGALLAQDAAPAGAEPSSRLSVELNTAEPLDGGCRLTFLVGNGLGQDLAALSLEAALLSPEGMVESLTLFDFGELPAGRPRVRQFDLPDLSCESLGEVLINGVAACEGAGVEAGACQAGLGLSSRTDIGLLG